MSEKSRKGDILLAIQSGDPDCLKSELEKFDDEWVVWSNYSIILDAAKAKQPEIVRWLIEERFPEFEPNRHHFSAAVFAGVDVFRAFLRRFPDLPNEDFGESGNSLGIAAFHKMTPMVAFLLSEGADPNKARWMHIPASRYTPSHSNGANQREQMRRIFILRWTRESTWMPTFMRRIFYTPEKREEIEIYRLFLKYGFDPSGE